MEEFFLESQPFFPQPMETIDTIEFLNASRGIVWLVEKFGFGFEPVKNDMISNIDKLANKYNENQVEYSCLKNMLLVEKSSGEKIATESLLWLRRGLTFMATFLAIFLENERNDMSEESLSTVLKLAYERTLIKHHNMLTKFLFKALCTRCPSRTRFVEILGYARLGCHKKFQKLIADYLTYLQSNLDMLEQFCQHNSIHPHI